MSPKSFPPTQVAQARRQERLPLSPNVPQIQIANVTWSTGTERHIASADATQCCTQSALQLSYVIRGGYSRHTSPAPPPTSSSGGVSSGGVSTAGASSSWWVAAQGARRRARPPPRREHRPRGCSRTPSQPHLITSGEPPSRGGSKARSGLAASRARAQQRHHAAQQCHFVACRMTIAET